MGFHNLIAKLGQSVTKMLDHNKKDMLRQLPSAEKICKDLLES